MQDAKDGAFLIMYQLPGGKEGKAKAPIMKGASKLHLNFDNKSELDNKEILQASSSVP